MATRAWWVAAVLVMAGCGTDGSAGGTGARPVTDFNGIPFGAMCANDAACGGMPDSWCTGGKCSPSGWCSPKCSTDKDCPEGFFCVDHDGTRCFSACMDDRDCLGHATIEMTMRYAHLAPDVSREAVKLLDAAPALPAAKASGAA